VHTPPGDPEPATALEADRAELSALRAELEVARAELLQARDALAALAERAQIEHEVLEAAPTALLLVDRQGHIVRVNRHAEQLFGYPRQDLLGQSITVLMPERFRPGHPALMQGYFAAPSPRPMGGGRELYGRHQDGREIPIEIGLMPIETRQGLATLASIIDISERKRAEQWFRMVVEASPSAMLIVSPTGVITLVNRRAEELFGYTRAELMGQPLERLLPERFRDTHRTQVEQHSLTGATRAMSSGRDFTGRRKDGTEMPLEIGLNPLPMLDGVYPAAQPLGAGEAPAHGGDPEVPRRHTPQG
jgi:PAS domain S-box-containing protein